MARPFQYPLKVRCIPITYPLYWQQPLETWVWPLFLGTSLITRLIKAPCSQYWRIGAYPPRKSTLYFHHLVWCRARSVNASTGCNATFLGTGGSDFKLSTPSDSIGTKYWSLSNELPPPLFYRLNNRILQLKYANIAINAQYQRKLWKLKSPKLP